MSRQEKTSTCPFSNLITMISKKWMLLVIKNIAEGSKSYSEIEKGTTGITSSTLSARLKELQKMGFIEKKIISDTPIKIEYHLSKKGRSFSDQMMQMYLWTKRWM